MTAPVSQRHREAAHAIRAEWVADRNYPMDLEAAIAQALADTEARVWSEAAAVADKWADSARTVPEGSSERVELVLRNQASSLAYLAAALRARAGERGEGS